MEQDHGRVPQAEPGSRKPSPSVSAASGFDPSRDAVLREVENAMRFRARQSEIGAIHAITGTAPDAALVAARCHFFMRGYRAAAAAVAMLRAEPGNMFRQEIEAEARAWESQPRDSDGSPKGGAASVSVEDDSAGLEEDAPQ